MLDSLWPCLGLCISHKDVKLVAQVTLAASKMAAEETMVVWSSLGIDVSQFEPYISSPRVIEFPTKVEGETAYANFYPPVNGDFVGQTGELPPLLVRSHGMLELGLIWMSWRFSCVTIFCYCSEPVLDWYLFSEFHSGI